MSNDSHGAGQFLYHQSFQLRMYSPKGMKLEIHSLCCAHGKLRFRMTNHDEGNLPIMPDDFTMQFT